jgi:hypothetical protein
MMKKLKSHYDFYEDPAHAWMKVPLSEIRSLGIDNDISQYSYMRGSNAYLEEDSDAPKFMRAVEKYEQTPFDINKRTVTHISDKSSKIRSYGSYKPQYSQTYDEKLETIISRTPKVGDRIRFTKSYLEGKTGTIMRIDYIIGIPWYEVKFDGDTASRGGQYEGMFEVIGGGKMRKIGEQLSTREERDEFSRQIAKSQDYGFWGSAARQRRKEAQTYGGKKKQGWYGQRLRHKLAALKRGGKFKFRIGERVYVARTKVKGFPLLSIENSSFVGKSGKVYYHSKNRQVGALYALSLDDGRLIGGISESILDREKRR